jgi:ATP dependent DNA ligase domain
VQKIKHDGYRLMARRDPIGIRLLTRNGYDWSPRYPLIVEAVNRLKVRSCLIDGEAVACDANGLAVFEHLRRKPTGRHVLLYAFDLLELDGEDLRREPLEVRKATLASVLGGAAVCSTSAPRAPLRRRLCARLQDGPGGHRVEAAGVALRLRPLEGLAQVQEPERAGGEAGGGGRLGAARSPMIRCRPWAARSTGSCPPARRGVLIFLLSHRAMAPSLVVPPKAKPRF